jgi:NitT/TauT family transport system substrate-binding protein
MHYNEYNSLINFGINPDELSVFYFKDYDLNFPEDGIYCTQKTYEENPELSKAFVEASLEGWKYALANPDETLSVIKVIQEAANVRSNKTHSSWMLQCMSENIQPQEKKVTPGMLMESDFNLTVDFLFRNQYIRSKPNYFLFFRGPK